MPLSPRLALLPAATLLLAACGKDASSSTSSGAAPAATTAAVTAAAPATAAPTPTATAAPAKGGACSFAGTWTGTYPPGPYPFSGTPIDITFNADGTGVTHSARADQEIVWKVVGGEFTLHGVKGAHGRFTCGNEDVARWAPTWSADCNSLSFKLVQDPCKGRAKQVENGITMKRK